MKIRIRLIATVFAALGLLAVGAAPAGAAPNANLDDVAIEIPCWVFETCPPGDPGGGDEPDDPDKPDEPGDPDEDEDEDVEHAGAARPVRADANFTG